MRGHRLPREENAKQGMAGKSLWLAVRLLLSSPREFLDRIEVRAEGRKESLAHLKWPPRADPKGISFSDGVQTLSTKLGRDLHGILDETELKDIEDHIRVMTAELKARSALPFPTFYNADSTLMRLCYVLCRALQPNTVVETGVAYGVTSAAILAALHKNRKGELHSVDLPPIADRAFGTHIGIMVPPGYRDRWHLHVGASKRILPALLATSVPLVDMFVHDSANISKIQTMEMAAVWPHMPSSCAMVVNAIQGKTAFVEFVRNRNIDCWLAVEQREKPGALTGVILRR